MTRNQYRKSWLRRHRIYERKAFRIFQNTFKKAARNIPFDNLEIGNYVSLVRLNIDKELISNAYERTYLTIGLDNGEIVGKQINKDIKRFDNNIFTATFRRRLVNWLNINAGQRITSVHNGFIEYILELIAEGISNDRTIQEIATDIKRLIGRRSFYRWQSMRIARTEATAAANWGAIQSGRGTGLVLEKLWISSNDSRTRTRPKDSFDHLVMEGIKTEEEGLFEVQGDLLQFPGDPNGNASNIINCRCTVSLVPKRNSEGRSIRRMV